MDDEEIPIALYALAAFNLADVVLTLIMLDMGGYEANPLMRAAYNRGGPVGFVVVKLGLAGAGIAILRALWKRDHIRLATFGLALIYAGVIVIHISTLAALARS